jgi:phenylacetate-CoA ligase
VPRVPEHAALRSQLAYLERSSRFYRERLAGRGGAVRTPADLPALPLTTKDELRADQAAHPPCGARLCAPPDALVRLHVTSGTTGEPVAIGLTRADHAANSAIGGAAFQIAGVRAGDTIAHCLNYALYAGGIADHMALEDAGATVVPVGVGQSRRLLELIPALGITAIFGTLSFPAHLAERAREAGIGMSDVWSTMAGECDAGEGLHLTTAGHAIVELVDPASGDPVAFEDGAAGELVWTHLRREASPLLRYRSGDLATVWTAPCDCGRTTPRIRIDGRSDDMLRVRAVNVHPGAIGAVLDGFPGLGRHAVVADGDPIVPPLRVYVETDRIAVDGADAGPSPDAIAAELHRRLRAPFRVVAVAPGALPVAEHKTRTVYRTARGDALPPALQTDPDLRSPAP